MQDFPYLQSLVFCVKRGLLFTYSLLLTISQLNIHPQLLTVPETVFHIPILTPSSTWKGFGSLRTGLETAGADNACLLDRDPDLKPEVRPVISMCLATVQNPDYSVYLPAWIVIFISCSTHSGQKHLPIIIIIITHHSTMKLQLQSCRHVSWTVISAPGSLRPMISH